MAGVERYLPPLSEPARRWARFVGLLVAAWALWYCAVSLSSVLTPILAGLAIAYILNPLITWLEREARISRVVSVTVGLVLIVSLTLILLLAIVIQLVDLADSVQEYWGRLIAYVRTNFPSLMSGDDAGELARQHGLPVGQAILGFLTRMTGHVGYGLTVSVLVPLYTFFFLLSFNEIVRVVHDHLPAEYRDTIVRVVTTIDSAIANFFRGRLVVCSIIGLLCGIGWLIVGVPHSLLLGGLAGVLNLVPFMSMLALPPALIFAYIGSDPEAGWLVPVCLTMGVYLVVQAIESFVLTPLIESRSSGLHPVTTVVALLIGGKLAGLLGMLLAIPIASTLKSLGAEWVLPEVRRLAKRTASVESPPTSEDDSAADGADADDGGASSGPDETENAK